ncbi:bifunctional WD40-YVTN repeat-like-containing domain superfamily/WD repeat BOP1-Erb1/WD40-repeat-containing domain superfamily [Babesia duncani]|uniref:Bifunctional WD40-YVTN repeat-like-containing domain superfamily/WD repeat BOP1-Erb1/WD40-repeat-containing domain superfamily n=1 Tax=Babesia duncani TaxID=323732 RepID=A0AAD9PJL7_9APIC|nr:bifunctional WD40-YVTN repeat-like-containing domain superfamily/WD repeat BOP1-Erb1/WD40-repeat-containing domain superfamily [Babesia duncani]
MNVDPESLLPKLPDLESLKPYPTTPSIEYRVENGAKRLAVDCTGRWLAIVNGTNTLNICDISCGRCLDVIKGPEPISNVQWHPHLPIVILVHGIFVSFVAISLTNDIGNYDKATALLSTINEQAGWTKFNHSSLIGLTVKHKANVTSLNVHPKGNYIVVTCSSNISIEQCILHCIPKKASMKVGNKVSSNKIRLAMFHPSEPQLIVAFTRGVRFYNLKSASAGGNKLESDAKKLSGMDMCIDMHMNQKSGSMLVAADELGQVSLFDLELGEYPYKKIGFQGDRVIRVQFHQQYPLMCIAFANCRVGLFHISLQSEMGDLQLVPVGELKLPSTCFDAVWHPKEPWLFTATPDCALKWV